MITKKQWSVFLWKMHELKNDGFDLYINENRVIKVDVNKELIYTRYYTKDKDGSFIRQRFTYEESINPYLTLKDLYGKISLRVTMKDLYKGVLKEDFYIDRVLTDTEADTNKIQHDPLLSPLWLDQ